MQEKMTSPKMSYEEAKKEAADDFSFNRIGIVTEKTLPRLDPFMPPKKEVTVHVNREARSAFAAGSDFGANYEKERTKGLVEAISESIKILAIHHKEMNLDSPSAYKSLQDRLCVAVTDYEAGK